MLSRRQFTTCVLCAAGGVLAAEVGVQAQGAGFTRTVLNRQEFPGDTMVTLQVQVDIEPGTLIAPHTHPGIEVGYVVDGGGTFGMKGAAERAVKPGDAFSVPPVTPHYLQNGTEHTRVLSVYVVDKNKPLASPATM
ncbi:MAG: cupin domain-containing protein [Vulcanimicrobiaceae bacterium]|jgi:quercetin dioxygenase-like cupin family protein